MKSKIFIIAITAMSVLTACKKIQVSEPKDFGVSVENVNVKLGDTVNYRFSGNPDNILYYSGEAGSEYGLKDISTMDGGLPEMQFVSNVNFGTVAIGANNVTLLVSTDFNGKYDQQNIKTATWTDITARYTKPVTANVDMASGLINLGDLYVKGKKMYVAFKYQSVSPEQKQRQFVVSSFMFRTRYPDGKSFVNASNVYEAGFGTFDFGGSAFTWTAATTSAAVNITHGAAEAGNPADEDWAISKGFEMNEAGRNLGLQIKGMYQVQLLQYKQVYTQTGVYKAVFIGQNVSKDEKKEVIKEFNITVSP